MALSVSYLVAKNSQKTHLVGLKVKPVLIRHFFL